MADQRGRAANSSGDPDRLTATTPSTGAQQQFRRPLGSRRGDPVAPRRHDSRWRLQNWRLRTKLAAVLLVPLVMAGVLGGLRVLSSVHTASDLGALQRQVGLGEQVAVTVHELQRERALAAGSVAAGRTGDRRALDLQFQRVDAELAALGSAGTGAGASGLPPDTRRAYQAALDRLSAIAALRNTTAGTSYPVDAVITAYSGFIDTLLELNDTVLGRADGPLLRQADSIEALAAAKEQASLQHATLLAASIAGDVSPSQLATLRAADAEFDASISEFTAVSGQQQQQFYSDTVSGAEVDNRERLKEAALLGSAAGGSLDIAADEWDTSAGQTSGLIRQVETALLGQLRDDSAELGAAAWRDGIRDMVIVAVLMLVALILLMIVARSLLRPLRTLRVSAFDVADRRLPAAIEQMQVTDGRVPEVSVQPVPVYTREEVGQAARAVDAVHTAAVRLAAEQALLHTSVKDIFVNLSRRNQGLVERQLQLIDELESSEQDPEQQLGHLFALDHLATRIRRNSENLLVLGGAEFRQRDRQPTAVLDVMRAATAEVEEYRRVMVKRPPGVAVAGPVVNDLVHLIAELLDNATSFSPPDTKVILTSHCGDDGRLVIEISDSGVGLVAEELRELNFRLATPQVVDVSVSRRMGLFVVGRLAQRHGLTVRLRQQLADTGLTAVVDVPAALLQPGPPASAQPPAAVDGDGAPDRAAAQIQLPMQVAVIDAPGDRDLFSPAAFNIADRFDRDAPRSTEDEWVELFGRGDQDGTPQSAEPPCDESEPESPELESPEAAQPEPAQPEPAQPEQPAATSDDRMDGPIFDDILSAWFRDRRSVPEFARAPRAVQLDDMPAPPTRLPQPDNVETPAGGSRDAATAVPVPPDTTEEAVTAPGWESAADEGWRAAGALRSPAISGFTAAGLPERRPRAHLVPGSAGRDPIGPVAEGRSPARSADAVHGRLSSYQRGLQQGRHARQGTDEQDE